jgi:hypothetical protein
MGENRVNTANCPITGYPEFDPRDTPDPNEPDVERESAPTTEKPMPEWIVESWYEIEFSMKGADDWFSSGERRDTLAGARTIKAEMESNTRGTIDYRIVKKSVTEEVIS